MAKVQLKNLQKRFNDVKVLHGIDLDIQHGEFVVLVGESGCGKSTLLRLLAGLEEISDGELLIDDVVVNHQPPAKRGIAMVFQSYALYPHMSVFKNMAFGLKIAGASKADMQKKVEEAARKLKIDHLLHRLPRELSGGQRQRVAIGRAIVRDPKVFLFDEPLSNLDASLRVQTRVELGKLHQELGATIVYVTHDQVEAMTLGDKIVVMNGGRIEQCGAPLSLYHHPKTLFVAQFIGSPKMNVLAGKVQQASATGVSVMLECGVLAEVAVDGSQLQSGDPVSLGIRPEHLSLGTELPTCFAGEVTLTEELGEATYVYTSNGAGQDLVLKVDGHEEIAVHSQIRFGFKPGVAHLFDKDGMALPRLLKS
ncbi:ABC transporter [Pokkaliibacter plantistimulans]|uniref:ABC transporter n=1 Tax=Proteobacteria bacterium 228 TaxID=2083153 RepID=A0A2S5KJ03_9PROT|nr:sn-glycerol-3-phosphate ABC transporter ATP-binding protein UgpC [Pokkaliibacter plantistimulans]PPC74346.1 ABC transporter [Pokkaliibacter plantistimulans]